MQLSANASCFERPEQLLIGGAHHRTGSELLSRLMGVICKHCLYQSHWKRGSSVCHVGTDGEEDVERAVPALQAAYSQGLRLLSSGRWALDPTELSMVEKGLPWKMVHFIRDPVDAIVSAYMYHLVTAEEWVRLANPSWYDRMGLRPPLPEGSTFAMQLKALDMQSGLALQATLSLRYLAGMTAVAERCARLPERCTNLPLKRFEDGFLPASDHLGLPFMEPLVMGLILIEPTHSPLRFGHGRPSGYSYYCFTHSFSLNTHAPTSVLRLRGSLRALSASGRRLRMNWCGD